MSTLAPSGIADESVDQGLGVGNGDADDMFICREARDAGRENRRDGIIKLV
jgi:hypothetical protein